MTGRTETGGGPTAPGPGAAGGRLHVARGPRAAEELVLREALLGLEAARADPALLGQRVRIVVPSRSLRLHLARQLVARRGGAVAGVEIQTLTGLALEVLERAGGRAPRAEALLPILVRQRAREESWLRQALAGVADGYGAVVAGVEDLLDAGFESVHAEILAERLVEVGEGGAPRQSLSRARALVRVAAGVMEQAERWGVGHRSQLLAAAAAAIARDAERVLPARVVLVHGFAELTARGADLIEALVRHRDAHVFLDEPPDPSDPAQPTPGVSFGARLRERLEPWCGARPLPPAPAGQIEAFHAPGAQAEVRFAAERVAELIERGVCPERIGVVARRVDEYRAPLRLHLRRLGIPFSGVGELGSAGRSRRRGEALLELLRQRTGVRVDRWLDALSGPEGHERRADLRLALRQLGALRLEDAAALVPPAGALPLAVRRGLVADDPGSGTPAARARRRVLPGGWLAQASERAGAACRRLGAWRDGTLAAHFEVLHGLLHQDLGWRAEAEFSPLLEAVDGLRAELPPGFPIGRDDFVLLLEHALADAGTEPLGGVGGGVQVLSVMEARARTFEHLFVLGANRDVFPRTPREDPLLPDGLRRALADVLPDVPIKSKGFEEERYLFGQLLAASPRVTLSWQRASDDGQLLAPSAPIERLRLGAGGLDAVAAPALHAPPAGRAPARGEAALRTPAEHALLAGLHAPRRFGEFFSVAVADSCHSLPAPAAAAGELVRARMAVLSEVESRGARLGPYLGFVGALRDPADPRNAPLYVTALENTARCPWQAFLRRVLRVEAPPDPLEALPGLDARVLGIAIHAALERIVRDALFEVPASLREARRRQPVPVRWPGPERLEEILAEVAGEVLREEAVGVRGLERVLVARVRPALERARALEWPHPDSEVLVLAAELEDCVEVDLADAAGATKARAVHFRADRVDAGEAGVLRLTDYKTGRPLSFGVQPETRAKHLLERVERGLDVQAVAYARAGGVPGDRGRFLYLREDLDPAGAEFCAAGDDEELARAFTESAGRALRVWDEGAFFPRLVARDLTREARLCGRCELAEACVRGDSSARRRLVSWLEAAPAAADTPAEKAFREAWALGEDA